MLSPGFEIYNDTLWPFQVSLNQVTSLFYGMLQPKEYFRRNTGAVWFTIKADLSLDGVLRIGAAHAVFPGIIVFGGIAIKALESGKGAFAAAGAAAAKAGIIPADVAKALAAGGQTAKNALVVSGGVIGDYSNDHAWSRLAKVFHGDNPDYLSKAGCYAGPPWPLRRNVHTYRITGGPNFKDLGNGKVELVPGKFFLD